MVHGTKDCVWGVHHTKNKMKDAGHISIARAIKSRYDDKGDKGKDVEQRWDSALAHLKVCHDVSWARTRDNYPAHIYVDVCLC